jgi:predicted nucleotide-binding protein (sugar kinase/HSP70/actin superfamily)
MEKEKIQKAWERFQNKMAELRKRRHKILMQISEKLDNQHMKALRNKLK